MKLQPRRLPFDYDPSRDSEFADGTDYWDDTTEQSDYTATITDLSVIDTTDTHRKKLFNNNNRTNDSETSPVWSKGHFLALLKVERLYRRYQGSYKWYRIVSELNKFYTIVTEKEAEEVFNSYMACMLRTPIDVLRNGDQYSQTIDHVRTDSLRRRKGRKKAIRVSDDISNLPPVKSLAEVMNDIEAVHEQLKYLLTCKISETYKRVFGWNRLRQLNMKISTLLRIDIHTNGHTIGYKNDNKLCNGEADHPDIASHSNNETNRNLEGNAKMNGDNLDECKIVEKKHSNGINLQIPFGHEIGITPFEERQNGYESTFPSMKLFHESMMSSR